MSARTETYALMQIAANRGLSLTFDDANTLRRAQITLHRWAELECGDSNEYQSWAIERNEETGQPFMVLYPHNGESRCYRIADREAGALRRIAAICKRVGAHYVHQTDPRGCALYISKELITDSNYTQGIACVA